MGNVPLFRDDIYQNMKDLAPQLAQDLAALELRVQKTENQQGAAVKEISLTGDNTKSTPVLNILSTSTTKQGIFVKQQATGTVTTHALTAYQASLAGDASAINAVSDNPTFSAVQITGKELDKGTLKIAHVGMANGTDAAAAAISIDLKTAGTAAQGIFITATQGATTGNLLTIRNNGREDLVLKANGRLGLGMATGGTPSGVLELVQPDDTVPGLVIKGRTNGTNLIEFRRPSDGATRTRVTNTGQFVTQETAYYTGNGIMVGGSSAQFGGGSVGIIGITNATTIPNTNPTGGIVMYVEGDVLKYRKPDGTIVTLNGATA